MIARRWLLPLAVLAALGPGARTVRADAVDDAFVEGNTAAQAGRWAEAVAAYERAGALLGKPNSLLSYNLGTAYAHTGELGRASLHLRQALDFRGSPTTELAESARANLGVVRRRAELAAATTGALIDRPQTWWDLVVETLRTRGVGWLALVCGLAATVLWAARWTGRVAAAQTRPVVVAIWLLGATWATVGGLHALSLRADRTAPAAVATATLTEVRDGPGAHRNSTWSLAGGAQVRIIDRTPGWAMVRLAGGIEGWVPEGAVAELERPFGQGR